LALCSPGCLAVSAALHYPFLYTEYGRTGFAVSDDARVYRYNGEKNVAVLETRGLRLEDGNGDGKVDRVKSGAVVYERGEPGTDALFREMDQLWGETAEFMSLGHFRRRWEDRRPDDIVDRWVTHPPVK
jgi:hypothetical protein